MKVWNWARAHPVWAVVVTLVALYVLWFVVLAATGHPEYPPVT